MGNFQNLFARIKAMFKTLKVVANQEYCVIKLQAKAIQHVLPDKP